MIFENNDNLCSICYENLDYNTHSLECNHKYHTNCIINWFRLGNNNCPLCNSDKLDINKMNYFTKISTIDEIIKFSKKKECPKIIKTKVKIIKNNQDKLKKQKSILSEFKKKHINIYKEFTKLKSNYRRLRKQLNKARNKLLTTITLNPIYILK